MNGTAIGALAVGAALVFFGFISIRWAVTLAHGNNTAGPAFLRGQIKSVPRMWTIRGVCFTVTGIILIVLALTVGR